MKMLNAAAVAERLDLTPAGVRGLSRKNQGPPFIKVGSAYRYPADDLEQYIETNYHPAGMKSAEKQTEEEI